MKFSVGYPWFFKKDALNSKTFPWSIAISGREKLLSNALQDKINLHEYINYRYNESLAEVEILNTDSEATILHRKISHLTFKWFMQTLLDRADKMSTSNGLEIRVPFCDYKLIEYAWNIPWELKSLNGREKGLLRYIVKKLLPKEIVDRKKSPYPKTHNPNYLNQVKNILSSIINNSNSPINSLINKNYILNILKTDSKSISTPWFGQLMTTPQRIAYLCQLNMWLEEYKPKIEI